MPSQAPASSSEPTLPAAAPAPLDGALMTALLEADLHAHLTPALLLRCANTELFRLLPLVLAAVQRVGETPGQRAAFSGLARALRARVTACRAVKLRLLLLCETPGYADFWKLRIVHRAECYSAARAGLMAAVADLREDGGQPELERNSSGSMLKVSSDRLESVVKLAETEGEKERQVTAAAVAAAVAAADTLRPGKFGASGLPGGSISAAAAQWKTDNNALVRYAINELFHESRGVPMRDHTRHLKVVRQSFLASEVVDLIMEHGNYVYREDAVAIGRKLQKLKLITRVGHRHSHDFADNDKLWLSSTLEHSKDGKYACITDSTGQKVKCWDAAAISVGQEPYSRAELKISCDMVDLQSLDFYSQGLYKKDVESGYTYGYRAVTHPLACAVLCNTTYNDDDDHASDENDDGEGDVGETSSLTSSLSLAGLMENKSSESGYGLLSSNLVTSVKVKKVFSSIARPMIVELRSMMEGGEIGVDDHHVAQNPMLLVKEGDNLGQDLSVELLFRCFNTIWQNSPDLFPNPDIAPYSFAYEVFPTSAKQGFMEAVSGLTSLKDFDWNNWISIYGKDPNAVQRMISSAAGSYIGAYILGAQDRHPENVNIIDGQTMMHLDFGFLVGSAPPIDGPQIAIYPQMEAAFRAVNAWDIFVDTCEAAFVAIRRVSPAITRTAIILLTKFGFSAQQVRDYISGQLSLNRHEPDELVAAAYVRNLVKHSSQNWKTKFKSYSHEKIDPAFYSLLQARFGPAVLAMKIVDAKQQGASAKLEHAASDRKDVPLTQLASIDE